MKILPSFTRGRARRGMALRPPRSLQTRSKNFENVVMRPVWKRGRGLRQSCRITASRDIAKAASCIDSLMPRTDARPCRHRHETSLPRQTEWHRSVLLAAIEDHRCALGVISSLVQPGLARSPSMHVAAKVTLQRNRHVRQRSENHRPRGKAGPYRHPAPRTPDHDPHHKPPASHRELGDSRGGCHLSVTCSPLRF